MKRFMSESNLRKKCQRFIVLISILISTIPSLYSQSLIENLGGVKTDFQFTTDSVEIPIIEQAILRRGVSKYNSGIVSDGGYGYGYGLQTFHLEFITEAKITERYRSGKRSNRKHYEIKLWDENDSLLLHIGIQLSELRKVSNGKNLYTYSINLNRIPIVLLDKTQKINIDKIKKGKK